MAFPINLAGKSWTRLQ